MLGHNDFPRKLCLNGQVFGNLSKCYVSLGYSLDMYLGFTCMVQVLKDKVHRITCVNKLFDVRIVPIGTRTRVTETNPIRFSYRKSITWAQKVVLFHRVCQQSSFGE